MKFKKLVLKNVRSYTDLEISFPKGSVLLSGDIGTGKTSILLGLQFALFGLQPGQKGASILRRGCDHAFAKIEVEIDGDEIIIERSIKKSRSGGITQDSNFLTINGNRTELSTSEMKERIIRLLNYPMEFAKKSNLLYKFTVYTPQEEMKSIIQEKPETRLDTLRQIFGIDRYKRIKENASILIQRVKEAIRLKEVLVSELNLLREKLKIEGEKKIVLARERNNLKVDLNSLKKEMEQLDNKIESLREKIDEMRQINLESSKTKAILQGKRDLLLRLKKEVSLMKRQLENRVDFSQEKLNSVKELLEKHKKILEEKNSRLLEIISKISALESKKESPQKIREEILKLENCPTCFQEVGLEHKERISKRMKFEIEDIVREIEQKIIEKSSILKEIEREKKLVSEYESDLAELEKKRIVFEHQRQTETKMKSDLFVIERTENEILELEEKVLELEKKIESFGDSSKEFDSLLMEKEKLEKKIREKEILFATKEKELEILKENLKQIEDEILKKEKIRDEVATLRSFLDWLQEKFIAVISLTEKNVMVRLREEFSNIFSEWFSMLVPEQLSVRLDEDFTPIITNQDYEIDYEFLSGGERTAVALAYRLALNQVLNSMLSRIKTKDVVILDEPTDGFASEQIDKMRDIFDQLKAEQIILVSHEQKIEGFVDHVIRVRKQGSSSVEFVDESQTF
ncbi:hypothetical protein D6829_00085 [Candidatus Pacearchaeota archaeon]|nr:MAG: hypothetical protein D6829_00085 [Candidatus Pacearchaeota archaeon]